MRKLILLTSISTTLFQPYAHALWGTSVWDRSGDPVGYSIWGFTGSYARTWVYDAYIVWDLARGQHGNNVQSIYMMGYDRYENDGQPGTSYKDGEDLAEIGWVKDPYQIRDANGNYDFNPHISAAWRWQNPPYYGKIAYGTLAKNNQIWLKIQKEWDGSGWSWHGYYGRDVSPVIPSTQILWVGNRAATGAPMNAVERLNRGYYDENGTWHGGDWAGGDFWNLQRKDRYLDNSPRWWGEYGEVKEAKINVPGINRNYSIDDSNPPIIGFMPFIQNIHNDWDSVRE